VPLQLFVHLWRPSMSSFNLIARGLMAVGDTRATMWNAVTLAMTMPAGGFRGRHHGGVRSALAAAMGLPA